MERLTPEETERMIRACIETDGPTPQAVMAGWRAMVFQILDRLDLGEYRPTVVPLTCGVVELWSAVQLAYTWPRDHMFTYTADEMENVKNLFRQLNDVGLSIAVALPSLPPRQRSDADWALRVLDDVGNYVRACMTTLEGITGCGMFALGAGEMIKVAGRCMNLIGVILGPVHIASFQDQYNECIQTWGDMTRAAAMPVKGRGMN